MEKRAVAMVVAALAARVREAKSAMQAVNVLVEPVLTPSAQLGLGSALIATNAFPKFVHSTNTAVAVPGIRCA
jgi:hypothetical protein